MFVGHFAVGFASKRVAPKLSLGTLLAAPLFLDLLWPVFLATGVETVRIDPGNTVVTPLDLHDYPYSHSLLMAIVWSLAFGAVIWARRDRQSALVVAFGVFSHWLLDFITHKADMPLYPGSATSVGLGLWNSLPGTLLVELSFFAFGVVSYAKTTRAKDRLGSWLWWSFVVTLLVFYVAALFGPLPPNEHVLMQTAFAGVLLVAWGYWIDRHRELRPMPRADRSS